MSRPTQVETTGVAAHRFVRGFTRDIERLQERTPTVWQVLTGEMGFDLDLAGLDRMTTDAAKVSAKNPDAVYEYQGEEHRLAETVRQLRELAEVVAPVRKFVRK